MDAETYDILDSVTYIANLSQANNWVNGPVCGNACSCSVFFFFVLHSELLNLMNGRK